MQAVIPHFQARKKGHLINISSVLARVPLVTVRSAYSASKAALNSLTANLRMYSLNLLRDQDLIGKINEEQITSSFKIRSIEPLPGQPWTYQAFGVKEVHRVRNKSEFIDRIVGKYQVRLIQDRRTERVPDNCGSNLPKLVRL